MTPDRIAAAALRSAVEDDPVERDLLRTWIRAARAAPGGSVEVRGLGDLEGWTLDGSRLGHASGRFFAVTGLGVTVAGDVEAAWQQPIVLQPEVGILGLLGRIRDGRLEVLVQAKWEPGNVGLVQASPSLQATVSNYTAVHGGRLPPLVGEFLGDAAARPTIPVFDLPQAEQGAVYLEKRNRNVLRVLSEGGDPDLPDRFRWVGLAALQSLVVEPHALHLDARSILGSIPASVLGRADGGSRGPSGPPGSALASSSAGPDEGGATLAGLRGWLEALRIGRRVDTLPGPLADLTDWSMRDGALLGRPEGPFDVVGVRVAAPGREVAAWDQPLVRRAPSTTTLLLQIRAGLLQVLIHARTEAGTSGGVALGPSLQSGDPLPDPAAAELEAASAAGRIVLDVEQSDEGGRFLESRVRHRIILLAEDEAVDVGAHRRWATLRQLRELVDEPEVLTMELRSLLAAVRLGWAPDEGAMWTS